MQALPIKPGIRRRLQSRTGLAYRNPGAAARFAKIDSLCLPFKPNPGGCPKGKRSFSRCFSKSAQRRAVKTGPARPADAL